ncbi:MAG: 16S rRNA processing protein RimM [Caldilineaceae bacterium]|nr:16S rRNA processing protein RimM [Caldilineaceae bacterium]
MPKQLPNTDKRQRSARPVDTFLHRNQKVHIPKGYIAIGMITSAHGLRGEMKVELHTDFPERFAPGVVVYLGVELDKVTIKSARPHQGQLLLQIEGIDNRTQVDALRGVWIFVPEDEAVELEEDTYFVHDIIGLSVQTASGELLGTVGQVLFTGANDVYVVETPGEKPREILLPAIEEVIKEVDLDNGILTVELLPGLLDE